MSVLLIADGLPQLQHLDFGTARSDQRVLSVIGVIVQVGRGQLGSEQPEEFGEGSLPAGGSQGLPSTGKARRALQPGATTEADTLTPWS